MNRPLRLAECFVGIFGVFATHFVGGRCIINNPFETHSRNVRNVFILCMLHIRYAKVWFLRHKSMVFGVQKPPFYIAKTPFLKCEKPDKEYGTTKCGIIYKVYCHRILMLNLVLCTCRNLHYQVYCHRILMLNLVKTRCSGIMVWCAFGFLVVANTLQNAV